MQFISWLPWMKRLVSSWRNCAATKPSARRFRPRLESLEQRLTPANWTVNVLTDTMPNDGGAGAGMSGDLRYCMDHSGTGDTVNFSVNGTITLQSQVLVAHDLTVNGGTNNVTISGNNASRIFFLIGQDTIENLTLTNGNRPVSRNGGAILSFGTLTLTNDKFFSNHSGESGGAVFGQEGSVTVNGCYFRSNNSAAPVGLSDGGAIATATGVSLNVNNSTFVANTATLGGAIFADGTTIIKGSTIFRDNIASTAGGALYSYYGANTTVMASSFNRNTANNGGGGNLSGRKFTGAYR